MKRVFYTAVALLTLFEIYLVVSVYQQFTVCEDRCEHRDMRCRGTSMPPWGSDMECLCAPKIDNTETRVRAFETGDGATQ